MTDAEYEAQKARIQAFVDRWLGPLGLTWWHRIDFEYHRTRDWFEENGHHDAAGVCSTNWQYSLATIRFDLTRLAEEDDAMAEYVVVHELMHIFVRQMREAIADKDWEADRWLPWEERTCTDLARAFLWTRDMAREERPTRKKR